MDANELLVLVKIVAFLCLHVGMVVALGILWLREAVANYLRWKLRRDKVTKWKVQILTVLASMHFTLALLFAFVSISAFAGLSWVVEEQTPPFVICLIMSLCFVVCFRIAQRVGKRWAAKNPTITPWLRS